MAQFLHVTRAESLSGFKVRIAFNNGDTGVIDLEKHLTGPVFEPLRDPETFRVPQVRGDMRSIYPRPTTVGFPPPAPGSNG